MLGSNACFPITAASKRQGCIFSSTPEVELVSADFGLREGLVALFDISDVVLQRSCRSVHHEGNKATMRIAKTGQTPR
eukprot:1730556-Lingulodinium_polyedra.AAC.1